MPPTRCRCCTDVRPSPQQAAALDAYLVTVCDHGMNASTFTARVIASTAGGPVLRRRRRLSARSRARCTAARRGRCWTCSTRSARATRRAVARRAQLARGERLMGFGHRVYRVRDPRAAVLEAGGRAVWRSASTDCPSLARRGGLRARCCCERHPERPLDTNVEFYTAVLLDALGLPREALHADLRRRPRRRLDRARARAAAHRPADPAELGVCGKGAGVGVTPAHAPRNDDYPARSTSGNCTP